MAGFDGANSRHSTEQEHVAGSETGMPRYTPKETCYNFLLIKLIASSPVGHFSLTYRYQASLTSEEASRLIGEERPGVGHARRKFTVASGRSGRISFLCW